MQSRVMRQMNSLAQRLRRRPGTATHLVTGERGEREALFHLRKLGYVIVARRWKTAKLWGDVDLIAWDGEYLCFVEVKTRSRHKPLSLLIESVEHAEYLARPLPDVFYEITRKYWPGPLTIIVKASSRLPLKVTANTGNVALRLPASKVAVEIIRAAGVPLTATSANISGASECTTAEGVRQQLGDRISLIVDGGDSPRDVASTIINMSEPGHISILRQGAIPESDLAEFLRFG